MPIKLNEITELAALERIGAYWEPPINIDITGALFKLEMQYE